MRHVRSSEPPSTRSGRSRLARRAMWAALAAATALVAACTSGGGSPSAPTDGGASPSAGAPSAATSPAASSPAIAYPEGPITFVVPFAAGGPTDTVTRLIAEPMSATLGQQIVVQNVAGAGGTLAAGQVAEAAPDGYTVLMHHIGMSTAPSLYADLPVRPARRLQDDRARHRGPDDDRRPQRLRADDAPGARRLRQGQCRPRSPTRTQGSAPLRTCAGCCS